MLSLLWLNTSIKFVAGLILVKSIGLIYPCVCHQNAKIIGVITGWLMASYENNLPYHQKIRFNLLIDAHVKVK